MSRKAKDTTNLEPKNVVKQEAIGKKSIDVKNTRKKSTTSSTKVTKKANKTTPTKTVKSTVSNKVTTKKASSKSVSKKASDENEKLAAKPTTKPVAKKSSSKTKSAATKKSTKTSTVSTKKTIKSTTKKPKETTKTSTTKSKKTTKASTTMSKKATKATTKKVKTAKKSTVKSVKEKKNVEVIEYYDLPYRYNQTVVKIIAQTPTTLFVYWDVSDEDKKSYIEQYGEYFYNNTKPVLIIHNLTKNYSFEIDINDYANSWYLKVNDSKCEYKIELGRRGINKYINIPNNYLYISSSNELESPNDHILFETMPNKIYFRNVKTGVVTTIDISSLSFLKKIGKLYNIKDFYDKLYTNKNFSFEEFNLRNPSSGNPSSTFK